MEAKGTTIRRIENLADFQMRKSSNIRFLKNCVTESVMPKGLKLQLQVQVVENMHLQKRVDEILRKTLMEITRVVSDEHYLQLQESKPKMTLLKDKLGKFTKDKGEFNNITHNIFSKTEAKKNKIVHRQTKNLNRLTDTRDCYILSQNYETDSENAKPKQTNAILSARDQTKPNSTAVKYAKKKPKQKSKQNKKPVTSSRYQKQQPEEMVSNQSINEVDPNSTKMSSVKMGELRQANQSTKQVQ